MLQCTRVCLSCGTNIIPSHIRESNALLFAGHIAFRTNHLHIYATPHFRCRELIRIHRRVHVLHVHIYYTTGVHNARALRSFCILSHFPPKMQITAGGEQHPRQHPPPLPHVNAPPRQANAENKHEVCVSSMHGGAGGWGDIISCPHIHMRCVCN